MFVSVIIPTVGRASLSRAVQSVLEQDFDGDEFEVIVVNDSGRSLAQGSWQESPRVQVMESQKRERCFARNAGATVAKGHYFIFLDDDDWLLPGAFTVFWRVSCNTDAAWIYGTVRFVDGDKVFLADHHVGVSGNSFVQMVGGDWISLTGSLIKSDAFFRTHGFDPRYIPAELHDINRKLAFQSELAHTTEIVACMMRDRKATTSNYRVFEQYNIESRDYILAQKGAFARMLGSVTDAYWAGKVVRAYLTCVYFNLRRWGIAAAISRGCLAMTGIFLAGKYIFQSSFWRAIIRQHSRPGIY